jgi:tetratricopeptide (TPR) repeat protein
MLTSIQPGTLLAETFSVIDVVPTPSVQHPRFRAMDLTTTSEVFVTAVPLLAGNLATLAAISDRLKKLSHPDIQAHLGFWTDAHAAYLVDAPLIKMASDPIAKPPTAAQLRRLVAALDYAEALGFHQTGFDLAWLTQTDHQGFLVQHLGWPRWALTSAPHRNPDASGVINFSEWAYQLYTDAPWQGLDVLQAQPPLPAGLTPLISAVQQGTTRTFGDLLVLIDESDADAASGVVGTGPLEATTFEIATPATSAASASASASASVILPGSPVAPGDPAPSTRPPTSGWEPKTLLIGFALTILAGFVFWVLPDLVGSQNTRQTQIDTIPTAASAPAVVTTQAPIASAKAKIIAEQAAALAETFLRKLIALEDLGLALWDPTALAQINQEAMAADDAYRAGEPQAALALYTQLLATVTALEVALPDRRVENRVQAQQALLEGNGALALKFWEIAAQLNPQVTEVQATWQAVQKIPTISALMSEADIAERGGQLENAESILREAAALFPAWTPSQIAFARIQQTVVQQQFQSSMSLGFTALAEESYDVAIRAFERAARIDPKASAARDGLEQVRQAQLKQQIQSLFIDAQKAETAGRWREAKTVYETARSLAPNLNDLMARIEAINARIELATALTQILEDPARLQSDAELNQARALAITISQLPPPVGDLQARLPVLTRILSHARRELTLTLTSDAQTTITVLRLGEDGRLGQITETSLTLFPGRYVVVGSRAGYKDVRHELTLSTDTPNRRLTVVCEEPI